ncbi:TRPM3-like protein, partial [Mya arenaria]
YDCADDKALWIDGGQPRCPTELGKIVVPILLGIYMIIANVLLLNLLIAMFSYTFSSVQDKSDIHWCYQRCLLVEEFGNKPFLVPPLNVLYHVTLLLKYLFKMIQCKNHYEWDKHKHDSRQTSRWESMIVNAYQQQTLQQKDDSTQSRVNQTNTTLEEVLLSVKELKQHSQAAAQEIKDMKAKMSRLVTSNANANERTEMCGHELTSCYPGTSIAQIWVPDGKRKW